jgi:hypothetical protein
MQALGSDNQEEAQRLREAQNLFEAIKNNRITDALSAFTDLVGFYTFKSHTGEAEKSKVTKESLEPVFNKIYKHYYGDDASLFDNLCRAALVIAKYFEAIWEKMFNNPEGKTFGELRTDGYAKYVTKKLENEAPLVPVV